MGRGETPCIGGKKKSKGEKGGFTLGKNQHGGD